jgi:hypothetical protein
MADAMNEYLLSDQVYNSIGSKYYGLGKNIYTGITHPRVDEKMRVIVTTRDTTEYVHPQVYEDAGIEIERGILLVRDFKSGTVTEYNSGWWNTVTYGEEK